jgi:tryptophan synthase alpha chain
MNPFRINNKQIGIFLTAGYPALESTSNQILQIQKVGIDFIELGIPFSDPMADGPVIQESSAVALKNGMHLRLLFEQLESLGEKIEVPIVLMGYLNPVLQFGLDEFLQRCSQNKIASVILPDMSVELYQRFYKPLFERYEIAVSFLITPTTEDERIKEIVKMCDKSFVYLASNGITGGRNTLDITTVLRHAEIKKICGATPLMLGFGITNREDVQAAHSYCDGAIIGTAFLQALKNNAVEEFFGFVKN